MLTNVSTHWEVLWLINVKSHRYVLVSFHNHAQQKALKLLYKIYIFDYFFNLKAYMCNWASSNQVSTCERLKEECHNLATKKKQATHPTKIIKVLINQEKKTIKNGMFPNFSLCTKNTQEHKNIRVKRKKANNQKYALFFNNGDVEKLTFF